MKKNDQEFVNNNVNDTVKRNFLLDKNITLIQVHIHMI